MNNPEEHRCISALEEAVPDGSASLLFNIHTNER
jgi:hypothetical protein